MTLASRTADRAAPVTGLDIRPATRADLPRLGRLGALLVEEHHVYDARRFLRTAA